MKLFLPAASDWYATHDQRCMPAASDLHETCDQRTKTNKVINVCIYNPRTINVLSTHALDTMLHEIENIKWDVIGLSETKEKECKNELLDDLGHEIFFSGNSTSRSKGVGFLVNKRFCPLIEDYQPISDRLALLSIKTKFSKITFIQCYFPTSSYPDEDIINIYDQIEELIKRYL